MVWVWVKFMSKNWVASSLGQFGYEIKLIKLRVLSQSANYRVRIQFLIVPGVAPKLGGYKSTEAVDNG